MAKITPKQKSEYVTWLILMSLGSAFPLLFLYVFLGNAFGIAEAILLVGAVLSFLLGTIIFWLSKIESHMLQLVKDTVRFDDE